MSINSVEYTIVPIGFIRTPFSKKADAPNQPKIAGAIGTVRLNEGCNFEQALTHLEGMEKIWLLSYFDRSTNWKPMVQVPRGPLIKRGLFATRAPHRPNSIGLSLVDLVAVNGLSVTVQNVDLLDNTPILDIKPYLPKVEAYPNVKAGWIDEVDQSAETRTPAKIKFSELADEQTAWLNSEFKLDLREKVGSILSLTSDKHPYRRVRKRADGLMELSIQSWRIVFSSEDEVIFIHQIESGYKFSRVQEAMMGTLHDDTAHRLFHARYFDSQVSG